MRNLDEELFSGVLTVGEALEWGKQFLVTTAGEEAGLESRSLLSGLLDCSYTQLHLNRDKTVPEDQVERFKALIHRRAQREPVAYLLRKKNFLGRDFMVDPRVLIPRPETEILVEVAFNLLKMKNMASPRILEIGTGSGCIAISLALAFPQSFIAATEVSSDSLELAKLNAQRLNDNDNLQFFQSDLYRDLPAALMGDFDMIISNPPYVLSAELTSLDPDIRYEPRLALDGGIEGTTIIRPLIFQAKEFLKPQGFVMLEIGHNLGFKVKSLFETAGFNSVVVVKDYQEHDRIVKGEWNGSV